MDLGLAGAASMVTGGTRGMGRAVGLELAREGARVAILARSHDDLRATVAELQEAGAPDAVGIVADFGAPASVVAAFAEVGQRWGELNVLVHTVGPGAGDFDALSDADWESAYSLGTMSGVRAIREALPLLRAAEWGRIVTFGAQSVRLPKARTIAYSASKAALASVTKNLSRSLASEGILVNCVCPGTFMTSSFAGPLGEIMRADGLDPTDPVDAMAWIGKTFDDRNALGRAGLPGEIASLTAYLVSRRNSFVTGATINADGGSDFF